MDKQRLILFADSSAFAPWPQILLFVFLSPNLCLLGVRKTDLWGLCHPGSFAFLLLVGIQPMEGDEKMGRERGWGVYSTGSLSASSWFQQWLVSLQAQPSCWGGEDGASPMAIALTNHRNNTSTCSSRSRDDVFMLLLDPWHLSILC